MDRKVIRREFLTLRVSKSEKQKIIDMADADNKDVSSYIRERLLNAEEVSV